MNENVSIKVVACGTGISFSRFLASGDKREAKSPGLLGVSWIRHRSSGVPYKRESPTLPDETKFEPVLEAGI